MAHNRSSEIKKIESDLGNLSRASMLVGEMQNNNNKVNMDLSDLADSIIFSVNIPQEDFKLKMQAVNENIEPSLSAIGSKISRCVDYLEHLLEQYKEEQREWEEEQRAKQSVDANNKM